MMSFSNMLSFNHLLIILLSIWHVAASFTNDEATMDEVELKAVYEVLEAINDEIDWRELFPGDPCTGGPHGVVCDVFDNRLHVVELNLGWVSEYGNNPPCGNHATIHPSILTFTRLTKLFFYRCFLSSFQLFPPQFAALGGTLKHLTFQGNPGLIGIIPTEIAHLVHLERLVMIDNGLEGSIPPELSDLKSLQQLVLSGNNLSGIIPKKLGKLQTLKVLDLSRNQLSGELDPSLGSLSNLQKLDFNHNDLQGDIPAVLGDLQALEFLDLSFNSFTGFIPEEFGQMRNIRSLLLHNNKVGGSLPDIWGNLNKLTTLKLSDCNYEGAIPESIGSMQTLNYLSLNGNRLSGCIPLKLGELKNLYHVNLSSNLLSGQIPFSTAFLSRLGRNILLVNNLNLCSESTFEGMKTMGVSSCSSKMISSLHQLGASNSISSEVSGAFLRGGYVEGTLSLRVIILVVSVHFTSDIGYFLRSLRFI